MTVIDICENGKGLEDKRARIIKSQDLANVVEIDTKLPTQTDLLDFLLHYNYVTQVDLDEMEREGRVYGKDLDDDAEGAAEDRELWWYTICGVSSRVHNTVKWMMNHCQIINMNQLP